MLSAVTRDDADDNPIMQGEHQKVGQGARGAEGMSHNSFGASCSITMQLITWCTRAEKEGKNETGHCADERVVEGGRETGSIGYGTMNLPSVRRVGVHSPLLRAREFSRSTRSQTHSSTVGSATACER